MGRVFRYVGLGTRVGLGGPASSGWWELGCSLKAGFSPAYRQAGGECTRAVEFVQKWGQHPAALLVLRCPRVQLGSGLWGNPVESW